MCAVEVAFELVLVVVILVVIVIVVVHEILHEAQILIDFLDVVVERFRFLLQFGDFGAEVGYQVEKCVDHFCFRLCGIQTQSLRQTLDIRALFGNIHTYALSFH